VAEFVEMHLTFGVFGEAVLGALHPHSTLVRRLVRNPEAQHAARTLHLERKKQFAELQRK